MLNTIRLYYVDSHLSKFEGTVLDCIKKEDQYLVVLDKTAFFPEGGGQPADKGFLQLDSSSIEVFDVQEKNEIIYHTVKEPINIGTNVIGIIDFNFRFHLMQHHSGEHIVSGLVHKHFGYDNVGFHMGNEAVTIDFNGILKEDDLEEIELKANEAVYKNLPIIETYPSRSELEYLDYRSKKEIFGQVRIVTIPYEIGHDGESYESSYDVCACCAPHVYHTGEIGIIKVISAMKYKGGTRVGMLCGYRALEDYKMKEKNVIAISTLLSAKPYEVAVAVKHGKEEITSLKGTIAKLKGQLITFKVNEIPDNTTNITLFEEEMDSNNMRNYCNQVTQRCMGICALFSGSDPIGYKYIIGSKTIDVRPIGKSLNATFDGKGGGTKEMVQGSVTGTMKNLKNFTDNFFA